MIKKQISFRISMRVFIFVSLLIWTTNDAICLVIRKQNTFMFDTFSSNQNLNRNSYPYYGQNTSSIETVEDNDPNYPYDQILQLVKDTKRILSSSNFTEKMQLNLDPQIYDEYLSGNFSDNNVDLYTRPISVSYDFNQYGPVNPANVAGSAASAGGTYGLSSPDSSCTTFVQYKIPRRLTGIDNKDYFIINVGSDLRQTYNSVICKCPKHKCGSLHAVQDYSFTCEQGYNKIRKFISIPVGNQISLDQQSVQLFRLPDSCYCKGTRNLE